MAELPVQTSHIRNDATATIVVTAEEAAATQPVFNDEHVKEIGLVKKVTLEGGSNVQVVGPAVKFSDCKNSIRLPPPLLGQHTSYILKDILNYSDEKILQLTQNGDVQ